MNIRPAEQDNFAPVEREIASSALVTNGALPRELQGTLYRNGPNPQFPSPGAHWFAGDGMVHAITIEDGAARYVNRWVRTPKWLAERRAGRALFRSFGGTLPGTPTWAGDDAGSANTNVVWHAGRLLALEEAHPPTELDPFTLQTFGYADLGPLRGPFTAHPKIDSATGELLFFRYNATGPFTPTINFGSLDRAGAITRFDRIDAPYSSMVHDLAVTARHVLFPVLPLIGSAERTRGGGAPYAWEPDKAAFIGVVPRSGDVSQVRWFQGEACYAFHIMNAWEEGYRIVAEVMAYDEPPLFPHADGSPGDRSRQRARLTRWTLDLVAGTSDFRQERIDDLFGEFPRIDDRRGGTRHDHGWYAASNPSVPTDGFNGLVHLNGLVHTDRSTGRRQAFWLPAGDITSEPVFAPRGESEGDGWLMAVVWRAAEARSEMLLFEAQALEAGPIATVALPQRIPSGFHGNWVTKGELALAKRDAQVRNASARSEPDRDHNVVAVGLQRAAGEPGGRGRSGVNRNILFAAPLIAIDLLGVVAFAILFAIKEDVLVATDVGALVSVLSVGYRLGRGRAVPPLQWVSLVLLLVAATMLRLGVRPS